MKKSNLCENLPSYQYMSMFFSLTQVEINREERSKADPTKIFCQSNCWVLGGSASCLLSEESAATAHWLKRWERSQN